MSQIQAVGTDRDGSTATADNVPRLDFYFPGDAILFTWTFSPLDQTLLDLRDLGTGITEGRRVPEDLPCTGLLAPFESAGSAGPRAGAPLAPLANLTVH